jgi:hypothetical protein
MPKFASYAEYCRHHRKVMLLAMELGVTPKEAEARMKAVEAREQHRAKVARRGRMVSALPPLSLTGDQPRSPRFDEFDARWMMRD